MKKVLLIAVFLCGVVVAEDPDPRQFYPPDPVETAALRDISRRVQEANRDMQMLLGKARQQRKIPDGFQWGWDDRQQAFFSLAQVKSDTAPVGSK